MRPLVIFVEEPSMEIIVEQLCHRFCPDRLVHIIPHEGKKDLRLSFPRKIRSWNTDAHFLILHDKDRSPDCKKLKQELLDLVPFEKQPHTKIRIVMSELESWYLSDLPALEAAGLIASTASGRILKNRKYRDIESLDGAKKEFLKIVRNNGQRKLARLIGPHLDPERSRSASLRLLYRDLVDVLD